MRTCAELDVLPAKGMVTVWPSCLPISEIVVTGEDIDLRLGNLAFE